VVPSALLSLVVVLATGFSGPAITRAIEQRADITTVLIGVILIALVGLASTILHLAAIGAATLIAAGAILGQPIGAMEAYRRSFSRFGSLSLAGLIVGVVLVLLFITCLGIPFAMYIGLGWSLAFPAIMLEGRGATESLGRSWALVKGHRWRLLICGFLIGLIVYLLVSIPSGLVSFVGVILTALSGDTPGMAMLVQAGNVLFSAVGQTLFGGVAYITTTLLYYDLRIRKEAFDLEQRLPSPGASYPEPGSPQYPQSPQPGYPQYPQPGYQPSPQYPSPTQPQYPPYGQSLESPTQPQYPPYGPPPEPPYRPPSA
jgi:hypothetical protein